MNQELRVAELAGHEHTKNLAISNCTGGYKYLDLHVSISEEGLNKPYFSISIEKGGVKRIIAHCIYSINNAVKYFNETV